MQACSKFYKIPHNYSSLLKAYKLKLGLNDLLNSFKNSDSFDIRVAVDSVGYFHSFAAIQKLVDNPGDGSIQGCGNRYKFVIFQGGHLNKFVVEVYRMN